MAEQILAYKEVFWSMKITVSLVQLKTCSLNLLSYKFLMHVSPRTQILCTDVIKSKQFRITNIYVV
jgi:hypothetical protein